MRFNVYGRFQVEVRREGASWKAYRSDAGKRVPLTDLVVPPDLEANELATYLDDIFHEDARFGDTVDPMPD